MPQVQESDPTHFRGRFYCPGSQLALITGRSGFMLRPARQEWKHVYRHSIRLHTRPTLGKKKKMKDLCSTRWVYGHEAYKTFLQLS